MSEFFYDIVIENDYDYHENYPIKRSGHNCTQTNGQ